MPDDQKERYLAFAKIGAAEALFHAADRDFDKFKAIPFPVFKSKVDGRQGLAREEEGDAGRLPEVDAGGLHQVAGRQGQGTRRRAEVLRVDRRAQGAAVGHRGGHARRRHVPVVRQRLPRCAGAAGARGRRRAGLDLLPGSRRSEQAVGREGQERIRVLPDHRDQGALVQRVHDPLRGRAVQARPAHVPARRGAARQRHLHVQHVCGARSWSSSVSVPTKTSREASDDARRTQHDSQRACRSPAIAARHRRLRRWRRARRGWRSGSGSGGGVASGAGGKAIKTARRSDR